MQSRSLSFTGNVEDRGVESRVFKAAAYPLAGKRSPEEKIDYAESPGRLGVTPALLRVVPGSPATTLPICWLEAFWVPFIPHFSLPNSVCL